MKYYRDKSYAIYGVLRRLNIELEKPDYSRPLGDIYKELFIKLISWEYGLNLLLESGLPGLANAPSWIPDWSIGTERTWLDSRTSTMEQVRRPLAGPQSLGSCYTTQQSLISPGVGKALWSSVHTSSANSLVCHSTWMTTNAGKPTLTIFKACWNS